MRALSQGDFSAKKLQRKSSGAAKQVKMSVYIVSHIVILTRENGKVANLQFLETIAEIRNLR
jgi:hypothetical protein